MFTGIVQGTGRVIAIEPRGGDVTMTFDRLPPGIEEALAAHLLSRKSKVTSEERNRLVKLIEQARKEDR